MRAVFTNREIILLAEDRRESRHLSKFADDMSFLLEGVEFVDAYREGKWDGRERLVKRLKSCDPTPYLTHAVYPLTGFRDAGGTLAPVQPEDVPHGVLLDAPGDSVWRAPIGLGENVLSRFEQVVIIDARRRVGRRLQTSMNPDVIPSLRPYQQKTHDAIMYADPPLTGKGLVRLPTRSGKTVIAGSIFARVGARGGFIVNSDMLLQQTVKFLKKVLTVEGEIPEGLPLVGQWGGGKNEPGWITVASVQSITAHLVDPESVYRGERKRIQKKLSELKRKNFKGTAEEARAQIDKAMKRWHCRTVSVEYEVRAGRITKPTLKRQGSVIAGLAERQGRVLAFLSKWDVLFFDECHHLTSELWREAMTLADAPFKIGLSATIHFDHENGTPKPSIWLMAATGPVFFTLTPTELIEAGWLCRPRITFLAAPDPIEPPPLADNFSSVYDWAIASNGPRNDRIVETVIEESSRANRVLVTVRTVRHAKNLLETFTDAGVPCGVIIGATSSKRRAELVRKLENHEIDVIVGTVFKEAVDLPFLETVIIGDGGASRILALQRLRNMTPVDDNDNVILEPMSTPEIVDIYDFEDTCHRFVRKHTRLRRDEYERHEAFIVRDESD